MKPPSLRAYGQIFKQSNFTYLKIVSDFSFSSRDSNFDTFTSN